MRFSVMWKDELCADVYISDDKKEVEVIKYKDDMDVTKMPFGGPKPDIFRISEFLESRWYERARPDYDRLVEGIGCEDNIYDILKVTHGVMFEDFLWIKWEGEDICWNDVRIR